MPNRILKESICRSDQINQLSPFEETMFYRLIVSADDYGRFDGRVAIIKSLLFPLKDSIRADQIEKAINTLSSVELVERYTVAGKPFIRLTGWDRHQTIRAKKSKYPSPDEADAQPQSIESNCKHLQSDASECKQRHANVPVIQSESESNPNAGKKRARFSPPTAEDVVAYAQQAGLHLDAHRFVDFYTSNGWRVGKSPMKDWQAAVRTWVARDKAGGGGASPPAKPAHRVLRDQDYTQREYDTTTGLTGRMAERLQEIRAQPDAKEDPP